MAATPTYYSTAKTWRTALNGSSPAPLTDIAAPGASAVALIAEPAPADSEVRNIVITSESLTLTTAIIAGALYLYWYDGSTYSVRDIIPYGFDQVIVRREYGPESKHGELICPAGWGLYVAETVANNIWIVAEGGTA
ncbi:MAG TPA: hypothetical protein VII76_07030 [Acidimicrobiales bacterium]